MDLTVVSNFGTHVALGLKALGIAPGERVALVAENRPEWVLADLAIMSAGAVTVPAYVTNRVEDDRHVFADSGARAVIVSKPALSVRVLAAANQVETIHTVIAIEPAAGQASNVDVLSWEAVLARGAEAAEDWAGGLGAVVAALAPDDIACLFYTSGTGGTPKGVMTSHRNIIANCRGAYRVLETLGLGEEVFLSFLPLSHAYEHTAGMMFPISIGAQIYFAEGAETLAANLLEARPTIMTAVPRLYETLHRRILLGVARKGGVSRKLFAKALAIGEKRAAFERLSLGEMLLDPVLDRLVRAGLRRRFGGRLKAMVSGGAPLNPEIGRFFLALGVNLLQGYGQTESGPVISCNPPPRIKIDTVGPPLDGVRVRIAEDGEILVAGDNVMQGLLERPRGVGARPRRRLAQDRQRRRDRRRRLSQDHRPQARLHQEFGRRDGLAGARRGLPDDRAGDRPGDRLRRQSPLSRRGPRSRPRFHRRHRRRDRYGRRSRGRCRRSGPRQGGRRRRRAGQPGAGAGRARPAVSRSPPNRSRSPTAR